MSFIPSGYQEPSSGGSGGKYLKIAKDQTVRIRILSPTPVMGWEYWTEENRPKRLKELGGTPADIRYKDGTAEKPRFFWAVAVWNVDESAVQIWTITQASIRKAIEALCSDQDFGDPINYDLKISRKGEGLDTEYTVLPGKTAPFDNASAISEAKSINWDAFMRSEDPFKGDNWPREFWNMMESLAYSKEQAAQVLIQVGAVDAEGKPSTAGLTAEQYNQVLLVVSDETPF